MDKIFALDFYARQISKIEKKRRKRLLKEKEVVAFEAYKIAYDAVIGDLSDEFPPN